MAVTEISAAPVTRVSAPPAASSDIAPIATTGPPVVLTRRVVALLSVLALMAIAAFGYQQSAGEVSPIFASISACFEPQTARDELLRLDGGTRTA